MRALRKARGLGVNQLGVAVGIEPANLSRFERGVPGGVHTAKYLDLIAERLDTRASVLYAIAEMAQAQPDILKQTELLSETAESLTALLKNYLSLPIDDRKRINQIVSAS